MRILILNYLDTSKPGGISKVVREFGDGLVGFGHSVKIIQPMKSGGSEKGDYVGFRDTEVAQSFGLHHYMVGDIGRILRQIEDFSPEVINIHGSRNILSPLAVIKVKRAFPKIPLIFSPHHDSKSGVTFSGKYLFWAHKLALLNRAYRKSDLITVCSEFEKKEVVKCVGNTSRKIVIIPNGIDVPKTVSVQPINREKIILSAGYLFKLKGVQHGIRALGELQRRGETDWKMVICGKGPYEESLKRLVKSENLEKSVEWKGFVPRDELIEILERSRVALLVSKSENFGIFAAESLSFGVPTIVTDSTALREFGWVNWCYTISEPVDHVELAEYILKASEEETSDIIGSRNLVSWKDVCKRLDAEIRNI
tara:strand:- start:12 stop:1112 length:1101 start_codon:yes stop_codon:yes gene_type:complete